MLVPTVTLPKSADAGVTASWPCVAPVPARAIFSVAFEASELMEMLPLALPADNGVNATLKVTL